MTTLTIKAMEKLAEDIKALGRGPLIRYSYYTTKIYEGSVIDEMFEQIVPGFNKLHNKGYLVPIKYRELIEDSSDSKNESIHI